MRQAAWGAALVVAIGGWTHVWAVEPGRTLRGEVVDDAGEPIAGASVSAWSSPAGALRDEVKGAGQTDASGHFEMPVPFGDIRYTVWVRKPGHDWKSVDALAGGEPVRISLKRLPRHSLAGHVENADGKKPVTGVVVTLIPEYGGRQELRSDATGDFEIRDLGDQMGQSVIHARAGESVSPYLLVRDRDRQVTLKLGRPARVEGQILEESVEKGAADCRVVLKTDFMSDLLIETQSDKDGRYAFADIPPGRYQIGAMREDLYERGAERAQFNLQPGQTHEQNLLMHRRAKVTGRVLSHDGKPVEGAMVGMYSHFAMTHTYQWATASTDSQGGFTLLTGRVNEKERIHAFHARHGAGWAEAFIDEEQPDPVTIRLSGAMRVRGTVTAEDGGPVSGVRLDGGNDAGGPVTGEDGRFDTGWISLGVKPGEKQPICVTCPRPAVREPNEFFAPPRARSARSDERFYLHRTYGLAARPGEEADVSIEVSPAESLSLTGRVLDGAKKPVSRAKVILFAGNANENTWLDDLHPMRRMLSSRSILVEELNAPVGVTETDGDGQWAINVIRETSESLKAVFPLIDVKAGVFSVGAEGPQETRALVRNLRPEPGQSKLEVNLSLEAASAFPTK